jgi:dihydroneopterin aldolase
MNVPTLAVRGIRCHGFHGCLEEEARIGTDYSIDVEFVADISRACTHDTLEDTIDYVTVHDLVKREMAIRSKLIEHVAMRILTAQVAAFPSASEIRVHVTKHRPPINNGYMSAATVTVTSLDFNPNR